MPEMHRDGRGVEAGRRRCRVWRLADGVEIARRITAENHLLGSTILDREAKIIKFNVNWIITGESSYRDKVLNEVWRNKNVREVQGCRVCGDGEGASVRYR